VLALAALATASALAVAVEPANAPGAAANPAPRFSHPGGYYDRDLRLELIPPSPGATIRFTVDGSTPTATHGTVYTQPIHLQAGIPGVTVVRARALAPDAGAATDGEGVVSASYMMGVEATLPIISLIVDPDDLWQPRHGIYADPLLRGIAWERPVDVTFVDTDRTSGFHTGAGIRIHGYQSRAFAKKSFRLYFRSDYGVGRLTYPLFDGEPPGAPEAAYGGEAASFNRLVLHSGGQDWPYPPLTNWTLLRNQVAAALAFEVNGYATRSQPAVLFLNGEPWGIYQIRERIDEDFLADRYNLHEVDLLDSPESALRETLIGDRAHWDNLMAYVEAHDLADPTAYAYVESQVDLANFIDYVMIQIYSANTDWPAHNVYLLRPRTPGGRWQWVFWDSDNGFGADVYSQIDTDMISHLLDYNHPETGGRDVLLFRKLLDNPEFFERFVARAADLLNTVLAPDAVLAHVDALAGEIAPDITFETRRWPGPTDWHANVQELRAFATGRPDHVREHMAARFNLGGTVTVNVQPPPSGGGTVAINRAAPPALPWQGTYFQGMPVRITALPAPGYRFAGWEPAEMTPDTGAPPPVGASATLTLTGRSGAITLTPRFVRAAQPADGAGAARFLNVHVDAQPPGAPADTGRPPGPTRAIEGDWFEIQVRHWGGLDMRGWRITDNDTLTATDEGSLILPDHPALARVPWGTTLRVIATRTAANDERFPRDDLDGWDREMVLYAGNGGLDGAVDPWFNLGARDNLALLAPGATPSRADDRIIALWSSGPVTPITFQASR
jgi:hypothetical protein